MWPIGSLVYINISYRQPDKTITNKMFSSNSGDCDVPNFVTIREDSTGELPFFNLCIVYLVKSI